MSHPSTHTKGLQILLWVILITGLITQGVFAQDSSAPSDLPSVFDGVGITEKLGETIPMDLVFNDENGSSIRLGDYFGSERPVILNLVYHNCPMLCNIMLESFTKTVRDMDFLPGTEFDILTVSFSAIETADLAMRQKQRYLEILDRDGAAEGWHFLTGSDENIQKLASSVGFRFRYVEETREFAHPAALIFLSDSGKITRYIHGMSFPKQDVRRAVVEASEGRVGSTVDQIFLFCYRYDVNANSYVLQATRLMRLGGFLTLLVVVTGLFLFWRRERRRQMATSVAHS